MVNSASGLHEVEIEGSTYEFEKWGAKKSLKTLLEISKLVGRPLGGALGKMMGEKGLNTELGPEILALILEALTERFDVDEVSKMIEDLTSHGVMCDGKKINFDTHYAEQLHVMFQVVYAALEVQYGSFFVALFSMLGVKPVPLKGKGHK